MGVFYILIKKLTKKRLSTYSKHVVIKKYRVTVMTNIIC